MPTSLWSQIVVAFSALFGGGEPRRVGRPVAFTVAVIALAAKMAKSDGRVTHDEVRAFRESFSVPAAEMPNVARVFDLARRSANGYEVYAKRLGRLFADDPAVLEEVLDVLLLIAEQDGGIKTPELAFLRGVARAMGLPDAAFEQLRAARLDDPDATPHEVLGVAVDADAETVKAAWRCLVRELHPDTLMAHGMPAEFVSVATERLQTVNRAYAALTRKSQA
ncbi:MAG: molecular chaperone DjiA [Alphaproteobacteria bacterium]|nr:molecular chaperone DjiA [Alphaproteobacteria bacterium]